jgi:UDP-N-acetylglucosamine--N-acetylmuramyl-(pentapeptide) pyrophosphoryl-undecaprenol N-acetylglucosamine transferase
LRRAVDGSKRILALASRGGHVTELRYLLPLVVDSNVDTVQWCTSDVGQEGAALPEGAIRDFPEVAAKDIFRALTAVPRAAHLLSRARVDMVVTTGSAIAGPFAIAAKLLRIPFTYIESATRTAELSVTGKAIRTLRLGRVYAQNRSIRDVPFLGNVFDGFTSTPSGQPTSPIKRAVVTFGTGNNWPFTAAVERLVTYLPRVLEKDAEVLWQTGVDGHIRGLGRTHRYVPPVDLRTAMGEADLVVGHAGVGTALMALEAEKVPVLLARRRAKGEHTDDHQEELAGYLSSRGLAVSPCVDQLTDVHLRQAVSVRARHLSQ